MLWKLTTRYLRPHWLLVAGVAVLQVLQSLALLYLPALKIGRAHV